MTHEVTPPWPGQPRPAGAGPAHLRPAHLPPHPRFAPPDPAPRPGGRRGVRRFLGELLLGLAAVAFGVLIMVDSVETVVRNVVLDGEPTTTTALVRGHITGKSGPTGLRVAFTTPDGRSVHTTVSEFRRPVPTVGSTLVVRYDPTRPRFARDARAGPASYVWSVVQFALGISLVAGAGYGWVRGYRRLTRRGGR